MLKLWKLYLEKTLKQYSQKSDGGQENNGNSEDVMIKVTFPPFVVEHSSYFHLTLQLIRIIANMVINPEVGKTINEHFGVQLVDEFLKVLISNPFRKNEELTLSILSTLNNLSYYYTPDFNRQVFNEKQINILEAISEYMENDNKESIVETMRILGNLSRSSISRDHIMNSNIFDALFKILDKGNR